MSCGCAGGPRRRPAARAAWAAASTRSMAARHAEADEYFAALTPAACTADEALVLRQAVAGLLWSKQFYHYNVAAGSTAIRRLPAAGARRAGRNGRWWHLSARDVIAMPDTWEYPWFAAWDLAFHAVALAGSTRSSPSGSCCCCCGSGTCTPAARCRPTNGTSATTTRRCTPGPHSRCSTDGGEDFGFLKQVFHKLLMNFTWWVNHADANGNNVFEGGFLGLDNIGPFDRSAGVPAGGPRAERRHRVDGHVHAQHDGHGADPVAEDGPSTASS